MTTANAITAGLPAIQRIVAPSAVAVIADAARARARVPIRTASTPQTAPRPAPPAITSSTCPPR